MKKLLLIFIAILTLITIFGPWDTYHVSGENYTLGHVSYVAELPVWVGNFLKMFSGTRTKREILLEHLHYYEDMIEFYKAKGTDTEFAIKGRDNILKSLQSLKEKK